MNPVMRNPPKSPFAKGGLEGVAHLQMHIPANGFKNRP
jgi:hypothetical protein